MKIGISRKDRRSLEHLEKNAPVASSSQRRVEKSTMRERHTRLPTYRQGSDTFARRGGAQEVDTNE